MYSRLTLAPVLGSLAMASLVSAIPLEKRDIRFGNGNRGDHVGSWGGQGGYSAAVSASSPANGYYRPPSATQSWAAPSSTYGSQYPPSSSGSSDGSTNPFNFPTSDGFPNIQNPSDALTAIEVAAGGILPNGPPPPTAPKEDDLISLRVISAQEPFEVAYYTSLLYNVTHAVPGFEYQDQGEKENLVAALTAITAQEKMHTLNANAALAHFNAGPIQPCQYKFPATDLKTSINVIRTVTDMVMATLQDVQVHLATNGDFGLIRGVGGVMEQEGEQNGYFRNLLGLKPSANAFLTTGVREYAFNALNQFIVPGSCPNINTIKLPTYGVLGPSPQFLEPVDQEVQFFFSATGDYAQYATNYQNLELVFINQQNVPLVAKTTGTQVDHYGTVTFSAHLPYNQYLMNGLTIAVVVDGAGPYNTIADVVAATKFGPNLIEIN